MGIIDFFKRKRKSALPRGGRGGPRIDPGNKRTFWVIIVLFVIVGYMIFIFSRSVWESFEINRQVASLESEMDELDARFDYQKNLISYYGTKSFLEKEARSKLGLKKEGELVLALPRLDQEDERSNLEIERLEEEKPPNIEKWWHFFFKQ